MVEDISFDDMQYHSELYGPDDKRFDPRPFFIGPIGVDNFMPLPPSKWIMSTLSNRYVSAVIADETASVIRKR